MSNMDLSVGGDSCCTSVLKFKAVVCPCHSRLYRLMLQDSVTPDCWDLLNPHILLKLVSTADIIKAFFFLPLCVSLLSVNLSFDLCTTISVFFICVLSCSSSSLFFCACLMSKYKKSAPPFDSKGLKL